ncbi:MAG: tRNA uridine-5-carboxymethylaminomethyl(34) synthesis GTPase MnmE [Xanthobacteraceae bacterium]
MIESRDTIFALSSGHLPAAIAIIRISGPKAGNALEQLTGRLPKPRQAALVRVRDPGSREVVDEGLALWFPGPHSETGEDVAELQVHGGRAVVSALLGLLGKLEGLRPAEAGEFTRRAFENGRMDLTAVEGLADLVAAETPAQRRQAYEHLKGFLGQRAETWRQRLIDVLALIEAGIDFPEEEDVPREAARRTLETIKTLAAEIRSACSARGERMREGLRVAIAGPPNAGKSTLFNRLARREAAIVSPYPGTTRDVLELHLDLGGYPVTVLDTAGIRATEDPIEQEGVRRANEQAKSADLTLWVVEAAGPEPSPADIPTGSAQRVWVVVNKIDLVANSSRNEYKFSKELNIHSISAFSGTGVDRLLNDLGEFAMSALGAEPALVTRERQRAHLVEAVRSLEDAGRAVEEDEGAEIVSEQLRLAVRELGKLLGRVDVEDVLDVIFRDFCIGK